MKQDEEFICTAPSFSKYSLLEYFLTATSRFAGLTLRICKQFQVKMAVNVQWETILPNFIGTCCYLRNVGTFVPV
jgi:hypothetical protein